jgi:hypothetical protein
MVPRASPRLPQVAVRNLEAISVPNAAKSAQALSRHAKRADTGVDPLQKGGRTVVAWRREIGGSR